MIEVKLKDAEGRLEKLIEEAAAGEEVVITSASGAAVRLVALPPEGKPEPSSKVIGHALDRFIGTWSAEQEAEVLQAIAVFEQVDESFWM
jgi:prevent-host-death family protein